MRYGRFGTSALLGVGAVLAVGLGTAPLAMAAPAPVAPASATVTFDCGSFGSGVATLVASQNGTAATISGSGSIIAPFAIPANAVTSTLTLANASGGTSTFSGTANPAAAQGAAFATGPMTGSVNSGDSLTATTLNLSYPAAGISVNCTATTAPAPGPFVFS
ncbi:hypothetical protein [Kitasatospora sp. NPDC089509]|uniref:hypothetical protein n=1 Tax=Kitasatospora sp. NPDC089509 TaxID=3364079 RepID=UPI00380E9156